MPNSTKGSNASKRKSSKGGRGNYKSKVVPDSNHSAADRGTGDTGARGGVSGSSGAMGGGQGGGGMAGHGSGGGKGGGGPVTGP